MDTKSTRNKTNAKKLHPVRTWLCFALAMTMLFATLAFGLGYSDELYEAWPTITRILPHAIRAEYHHTDMYWSVLLQYIDHIDYALQHEFDPLQQLLTDISAGTTLPEETTSASAEIINDATWKVYTHFDYMSRALLDDVDAQNITFTATLADRTSKTETLDLFSCGGLALSAGKLYVIEGAPNVNTPQIPGTEFFGIPCEDHPQLYEYLREIGFDFSALNPDLTVVLLPNETLMRSIGLLGDSGEIAMIIGAAFWGSVLFIALIFILFIAVAIGHRSQTLANDQIGRFLGHIWIEVRLAILFFVIGIYAFIINGADEMAAYTFLTTTAWFWIYLISVDLRTNKLNTFKCNIYQTIIGVIRRRYARLPLHRALAHRGQHWLLPAFLCGVFSALMFFLALNPFDDLFIFLFLLASVHAFGGMLIFLALNYRARQQDMADIAALANRIQCIHNGQTDQPLHLPAESLLAPCAAALEDIQTGIELAVAERMRSERTKIEMVTNISHDLKTPLTAIVGYADLLSGVEGLPPEAADYVSVIMRKSARLNLLIKDLFALSKATTSDLPLQPEPMDLARLISQLLAEQSDAIETAPITLLTSLPAHECPLFNDGEKLYRVFANLLENALRYSLDGSRVFLTLSDAIASDGRPVWRVIIKNTSRELIDFSAEEILSRFVRGDKNRTSDGNGLGLPIAKSFTELCGGRFALNLDGDCFTVIIDLPQNEPPQQ